MKRILSFLLVLLLLTLTACGSAGGNLPSSLSTATEPTPASNAAGTNADNPKPAPVTSAETTTEITAAEATTDTTAVEATAETTVPTEATSEATTAAATAETAAATTEATTAATTEATTAATTAAATTEATTAATTAEATEATTVAETDAPGGGKALILYFSCTGTTRTAAERIAALCDADLMEIVPAEPYSAADLSYNNDSCRANREMNDPDARPAIAGDPIDLADYDTVFLGYPIWWGTMPRIINTFLDTYDLSGKVVLPFCTSGSSGIATSVSAIRDAEPDADVRDGLRISGTRGIDTWLENNSVPVKAN